MRQDMLEQMQEMNRRADATPDPTPICGFEIGGYFICLGCADRAGVSGSGITDPFPCDWCGGRKIEVFSTTEEK